MQLSPRQYQVDPTGSSYVADTRPLMAAMGAQAATQIEGNRMMQETVQRGMKGVEDFAARRQLAAARAQLGELNINDPDYGQKLSGLVMDNPLAFTNEKTAGVANFAFKQAANDFQSKRENEQRMALQAAEFNLRRDMANMSRQDQMSLSDQGRADQVNALIFGKQDASLQDEEASLRAQRLLITDPKGQALIDKKLGAISNRRSSLAEQLRQGSVVQKQSYGVAPFPDDSYPAPTDLGNGAVYGEGNLGPEFMPEEGQTFGDAAQSDGLNGALFPASNALIIQGTNAPAATPVFDPNFTPEPAPQVETPLASQIPFSPQFQMQAPAAPAAPAATAAPASPVTPSGLTLEEEQELSTIFAQTASAKAKKSDEGMSASEYKEEEGLRQNIVGANPQIAKLRAEVETLKSRENLAVKAMEKDPVGFSPEKIAAVNKLSEDRITKESELKEAENVLEARLRIEGNKPYLKREFEEARKQAEETAKAQEVLTTAAATGAPAAGAGDKIPPPPDPTIGMSAMEKNIYNIETMRQEGPRQRIAEREARRIESNQQWNKAKEQVYDLIGGTQGLAELLDGTQGLARLLGVQQDQPLMQSIDYNANIPENRPKLANELAQRIREKIAAGTGNKKLEGFEQKLERLGPQKVSQAEIIAAVVEEIIRAQESAVGKVRTMSNVPTTPTSTTADGKTGTLSPPQ